MKDKYKARFWSYVIADDDCMNWSKGCGSHGYGQFYIGKKPFLAHRISWELSFGPIPAGMYVLHKCDNKKCVRPSHLFIGTQSDNINDCVAKGRHKPHIGKGEKASSWKINDADAKAIKQLCVRGPRQRPGNAEELAQTDGVSRARIYQISKGARE